MPTTVSQAKRLRQSETKRMQNRVIKSKVRTYNKSFLTAVDSKDQDAAEKKFIECIKLIDSATQKGVYHKNTAARKKSRMHKALNKLTV